MGIMETIQETKTPQHQKLEVKKDLSHEHDFSGHYLSERETEDPINN